MSGVLDRKNAWMGWQTNYLSLGNGELLFYKNKTDSYCCFRVSLFSLSVPVKDCFCHRTRQITLTTNTTTNSPNAGFFGTSFGAELLATPTTVTLFCPSEKELKDWEDALCETQEVIRKLAEEASLIIPVFFSDSTFGRVKVDKYTTAEMVWQTMCNASNIPNESRDCFFVWVIGRQIQLLLNADDNIIDVFQKWEDVEQEYLGARQSHVRFVFRQSYGNTLAQELKFFDKASVGIFYRDSVFHYLSGHFVLSEDSYAYISAIITQLNHGDWHQDFNYMAILPIIAPFHAIQNRKPSTLVSKIADNHHLLKGKKINERKIQLKLLEVLREQKSYGSTFFRAEDELKNRRTALWQQGQFGSCILGINKYGLHFTDVVIEKCESYRHEQIVQWAFHHPQHIWFEMEQEGEERNCEIIYKSKFASLIVAYMQELSPKWEVTREDFFVESD
eukprot:TRINITY_DN2125_c0_g1_i5.p1 TRINITY_DN2125_c0_g1~~TRINITY_DN2125_c0_g1_i5.p1  ORF type:complete len:447 (-),score=81.42 TRINITY_DN2125_c0_g1_i5:54-1394(-)